MYMPQVSRRARGITNTSQKEIIIIHVREFVPACIVAGGVFKAQEIAPLWDWASRRIPTSIPPFEVGVESEQLENRLICASSGQSINSAPRMHPSDQINWHVRVINKALISPKQKSGCYRVAKQHYWRENINRCENLKLHLYFYSQISTWFSEMLIANTVFF